MTTILRIRRDSEYDEYQVTKQGPKDRRPDAFYFTDDPEDAAGTAVLQFKDLFKKGKKPHFSKTAENFLNKHYHGGHDAWILAIGTD